nr:hypothetical protein [Tanacetum cinerariifolium]
MDVFQQEAWEKYLAMLHQALRFPKKLEQPLLLGGREGVPDYCGLAYECSKRWDADREYVLLRGCDNTEHTPYHNPETTRGTTLLSRVEPQILPGRRGSTGPEDQEDVAPEVPPLENVTTIGIAPEAGPAERVAATNPPVVKEHLNTRGGKSLAAIELGMGSTCPTPAPQGASVDVSDPDPLSFSDPQSRPSADVTHMLDALEACQDLVDHIAPPGYFLKLRHLHNDDFLKQYNVNLARQVAMGSQLRLRFEQEAKLLKKSVAQVARQDKRIQAKENEIKNLVTLLEAETDMKKAAKNKSAGLSKELENMRALFLDLQVSNNRLSQQVSTLQEQYEDNRVEQRCAEMDARLDALSIDFNEELYLISVKLYIFKTLKYGLK